MGLELDKATNPIQSLFNLFLLIIAVFCRTIYSVNNRGYKYTYEMMRVMMMVVETSFYSLFFFAAPCAGASGLSIMYSAAATMRYQYFLYQGNS